MELLATPAEIRAARAFLQARGVRTIVPPDKFANAAKELDMGFQDLLQFIMRLYSGGQNAMFFNREALLKAAGGEDSGL